MTVLPVRDVELKTTEPVMVSRKAGPAEPISPPTIRAGALAIFSGPSFPLAALGLPLVVSLPEFYANYIGVKLAVVGLVFMVVRLMDLSVDPVLGAIMDATRSRFGRFRPWMVLGAPILMIATYMIFMARPGAGAIYMTGWLFALYIGLSILVLSHAAWASILASGYNERSRIYGWVQNAAVIGMVLVLFLPPIVGPMFPANRAAGLQAMGWFIILLTPLSVGFVVWRTPEPQRPVSSKPKVTPKLLLNLVARPAVSRIMIADLCLAMAPGVTGALFIFFFREARDFTTDQSTLLLLIYFLGGLAGAPIWAQLARRLGKHKALITAALQYCVMLSVVLMLPKGVFWLTAAFLLITGLAFSAGTILLRAMLADASDELDFDGGGDRTGLLFALITSTEKVGAALSIGITYPILQMIGFNPKARALNTAFAIHGLEMLFVIAPILFALSAALALRRYHLDEKTHQQICAALQARTA